MASSRMNKHLSKKQVSSLTETVVAEIERIQNKISLEGALLAKTANANSGKDEVDSANDDIMKHQELRFATRETFYLKKLKATYKLMDSDEYGMCDDCGSEISYQRLMARPTSTMCITCKEEAERGEMQSIHGSSNSALGNAVSLS